MNNIKIGRSVIRKILPTIVAVPLLLALASNTSGTSILLQSTFAIEEFDIDVDVEDNEIERGDTQHITVLVRNEDTNKRVSDADVRLTVDPPDGDSSTARDETDNDGEARFDVRIDDDAETGEYDVDVRVSKNGYGAETVNTSFDVLRGEDDSNDKGDNDGKDVTVSAAAAASSSSSGSSASGAASGASSSK
ncbi:MAG: MG2 domain-containing protein [Nitrososphaeraceae archaeon]